MRYLLILTVTIATCFATEAQTSTQTRAGTAANHNDQPFLREAVQGNLAEIQLGQLAQKNGSSPAVKQFGERMVTDHTNLLEQARSVASAKGITVPARPSAKQQATYRSLEAKTGSAFDKAYITDMINDHTHDIAAFQQEANSASDPDMRSLASKAIPIMQEHLRLAENAARQLGIPATPSGGL
jgi:putative membrane protein